MVAFVHRCLERFHVTPAIAWSISGTLLSGLTGPVVALLIAQKCSLEMQGYYYTFNSLLALSVFLELGFNNCIVQFISHEYAFLGMENGLIKQAATRTMGRLASLVRLSLKWYLFAAILLFIGVGFAGELFFRHNSGESWVAWRGPWWCLCALSAINLLILPLSALLEGCDQVDWTSRARIFQNIGRSTILIAGLSFGLGLYAPAAATLSALLIYLIQFNAKWRELFHQVRTFPVEEKISWIQEILPFQWRIAVSWASGFFIFSLFNPLLFAYAGKKVAGQFGMTWAILSAVSSLSQSFVNTRAPRFAALIARKEWAELRRLWKTALFQAIGLSFLGTGVFLTLVQGLSYFNHPLRDRLSSLNVIILFSIAGLINQAVFTIATVARAEKKEPFAGISVVVALITATGSYFTVKTHAESGLAYSYLLATSIGAVVAWKILQRTALYRGGQPISK